MARGFDPNHKFKSLGKITVPFGARTEQEEFHPGIDIANSEGTPIPAFTGGDVVKAETGHVQGENNFGNQLEIRDEQGNVHQYNHLQGINVNPGQRVQEGQIVATLGKTGAVYSPSGGDPSNLDYRIVSAYSKYLNPLTYLRGR